MNANQIAEIFGCTADQVRRQFASNAAGLRGMAAKAESKGKKINGYTASKLGEMAQRCEDASKISQSDFFNLASVREQQEVQKRNPYNSPAHKAAWLKICDIAKEHGVGQHFNPSDY